MRRKLSLLALFCCLFFAGFTVPITVYATDSNIQDEGFEFDTGDAVADIMNDQRFSGAISSISWLTERIDYWFTMAITAVAFFIISAALLKNVCAGAYCSNHKFWDKVAEAHEKAEALSISSAMDYVKSKGFMNTTGGGLRDGLLCLLPNIKALTDFDDVDIAPKQYWMKAIPQMLGCIIIGVFVYNGYYRDTASTVGNFGSEICDRVFASVDPVVFVDKLTQTSKAPDNIFKNDATIQGEMCYDISMAIYKAYKSGCKGLSGYEQKCSVMRDCENIAMNFTNTYANDLFSNTKDTEYSLTGLKITLTTQQAQSNQIVGHQESGDEKTTQGGFTVDKNGDKYFMYYGNQPDSASSFTSDTQKCFAMSATLKLQKSSGRQTNTSIVATAGTFSSRTTEPVTIRISPGKVDVSGGKSTKKQLVDVTSEIESFTGYTSAIQNAINGEGSVSNTRIQSSSGWNQGTNGGVKKIEIKQGISVGQPFQTAVKLEILADLTTEDGKTKSVTFTVPVRFQF